MTCEEVLGRPRQFARETRRRHQSADKNRTVPLDTDSDQTQFPGERWATERVRNTRWLSAPPQPLSRARGASDS